MCNARDSALQAGRRSCVQLSVRAVHQAGGVASLGRRLGGAGTRVAAAPSLRPPALPPSTMLMKGKQLQLALTQGRSVLGPGKTQAVLSMTAGVHRDNMDGLASPHPSWDRCVPFPVHSSLGVPQPRPPQPVGGTFPGSRGNARPPHQGAGV